MAKRVLFLSVFISVALGVSAQFTLNGRCPSYDELTSTYLVSIQEADFGKTYDAVVKLDADSAWTNFKIDETAITDGGSYTFSNLAGGKLYSITALDKDGKERQASLSFTFLPILNLYGDFGYDYTNGTVSLYMPDGTEEVQMLAKLKWRGGSTNTDGKHKRNYHIKFLKENGKKQNRQFFGLRSDNNWLLDAAQVDLGRCRNRTATDLWNDFSTKPYYIDNAPTALTGASGEFCEVFLNNQYYGIYGMMENVDRKQMQLMEYDEDNGIYHGHLWKMKSWTKSTSMGGIEDLDENAEETCGLEVKYPDFDDVNPTDYSVFTDAVAFVVNCTSESFSANIANYFDIPVLVDYDIFLNVVLGTDNTVKNLFWACYDEQTSKKLTLGVWDLDATVGQNWSNDDEHYRSESVAPETELVYGNLFRQLTECDWFNDMVKERYAELRKTYLSNESLIKRYSDNINKFINSGAAGREENRWSKDTDISGRELNFSTELEYITDWLTRRMAYLDQKYVTSGLGEVLDNNLPADDRIYNLNGQQLDKDNLPTGIYIQNHKKYINRNR